MVMIRRTHLEFASRRDGNEPGDKGIVKPDIDIATKKRAVVNIEGG